MEKIIEKYFLNEGSKLVKVKGTETQVDAWFEDKQGNIQHRCVESYEIIRLQEIEDEEERKEDLISELKERSNRELSMALNFIKEMERKEEEFFEEFYEGNER